MKHTITKRKTWKAMLAAADKPVQLPVAHDALTSRLIELAGFDAYQDLWLCLIKGYRRHS